MLRLTTLGGLGVASSDRPAAGIRARLQGLAVLARLAAAGDRGLSREQLVACFWTERDERRALHSLSQSLHRVKTDLQCDSVVLGTRVLRLNPERISSDVGDLWEAARGHDADGVVRLHAGPFLDGIFFDGAPGFERWVDSERRRLEDACATCLREAATRAASAGDYSKAATWWRCLAAADPLDGRIALELVRALAAVGDRAAALREARMHETLVRTELRAEPDPRLRELVERYERLEQADGDIPSKAGRPAVLDGSPFKSTRILTPDELCARARQSLQTFTAESFAEGIRYGHRAVHLDPRHAGANLTLGWLYILLSQAERAGNPRARGVEYCRQAAALDPTLGAVSTALAWAAQLDGRFEEAEALALEGLSRDPADLFAHFALGWVRLAFGFARGRWDKCAEATTSLATAIAMHPRDAFTLMATSVPYTLAGQYDVAGHLLEFAVEVERSPASDLRTMGALALLGRLHLHRGGIDDARACLEQAAEEYADAPQIFALFIDALTLCGLGDLKRLEGRYDEAVGHYARAREELGPVPALMGCGFLLVRLETRLAGAFRRLRMRREEERHADAARAMTASRAGYSFNWCWGATEADLRYDWAVYHATCADRDATIASLQSAASYGWGEAALLDLEPAFAFCRRDVVLRRLVDEVRARPPLPEHALGTVPSTPGAMFATGADEAEAHRT